MSSTTIDQYLTDLEPPLREVGEKLRAVIDAALPDATAGMWHGHPVWGLGDKPGQRPVGLVKAYGTYVTFGLWRGQEVDDPSGRLAPGARRMASVRLRTVADVDPTLFTGWLGRARELER
ncbi:MULTISPECIES: DUF1801 domain-containing protein [Micromonospora]|uniref:DUF1801 domain-containing protein n=1 Tax=Micromonospora TaxID=1873 RepID=UPI0011D73836|nr:DUF1801 domain-containing protein [Micromonospora sp. WP24]TYB96013.1 DUF1801 domain-containing protein [Micromonospora sp. WP24]